MTPVHPFVARLVDQLTRLRESLPAAAAKKAKAEARVQYLTAALKSNQYAPATVRAYRAELEAWQGALNDPERLQADINAIEADLRNVAALIAQAVN